MVLQAIQYTPASDSNPPTLDILDQLLLPHKSTYVTVNNCEDAFDAIKKMKVRGAPAIAIVAALALAVELGTEKHNGNLPLSADEVETLVSKRLEYLRMSRPTAVNLSDAIGKLKNVARKAGIETGATGASVASAYIASAEVMLIDDVSDNRAIGEYGAQWITKNTNAGSMRSKGQDYALKVLTHCNTGSLATAGYGTALGVIRSLHSANMLSHAYCTETRPYNQGSRLTAYELIHDEIPATLLTDSMAASLMAREGDCLAAVVVGADRVAANGDTANKIGTYSLAVLARQHGVKFLVAAPRTTIDIKTASGKDIVIEERPANELTSIKGPKILTSGLIDIEQPQTISTAASNINVWNPAFDVTPAALIDGIITELGVVEKSDGIFNFQPIFNNTNGEHG